MKPEKWLEAAQRTREMIALTQQFLDGKLERWQLEAWARKQEHTSWSGAADSLHACLHNIDDPRIRPLDLQEHLDALLKGEPAADADDLATLKLSMEEISRRVSQPVTRFFVDGLGMLEKVRFASPATGRTFYAIFPLRNPGDPAVLSGISPRKTDDVLADLFDTLVIDAAETSYFRPPLPPTWNLMRLDDNVNQFLVESFTGHAKALARLAEYEAKHHKQSYWLELAS